MRRFRLFVGLVLLPPCIQPVVVAAQATEQVSVVRMDFRPARLPLAPQREWLEVVVELDARPADGAPGQVTGRRRIALEVAFEFASTGPERRFEFYRTSAEVVGLMAGGNFVRFYLPPERVRREAVRGAPKFWRVMITADSAGQEQAVEHFSDSLADPNVRQSFGQRVSGEAAKNHGVLLPQYLTPFASEYAEITPAYVRPEAGR